MSATLSEIVAHAKAYGFIYPSSEIYQGLQGVYDYGPMGTLLKRKIKDFWWQEMVGRHDNIVGLDAAILMAPQTWEASGHVDGFHDWMVDHRASKKRYRVDILLESHAEKMKKKGDLKGSQALLLAMKKAFEEKSGAALKALLEKHQIVCPLGKSSHWTEPKEFHLMFSTQSSPIQGEASTIYLRPETAQGIFVNFLTIQKTMRLSPPFGVAQIGKAFRNELIARQFIFRMREFEQMELQFFISPEEEMEWFDHWREKRLRWYKDLGIDPQKLALHPHQNLAHYAKKALDITYPFPFGVGEVEGIHARGDFDLSVHQKKSSKKMTYFDAKKNSHYLPHVVETSVGVDRLFLLLLSEALCKSPERTYLRFPPALAPLQVAFLPLLKKAPFQERAKALFSRFCEDFSATYDDKGSIGKRYARQDCLGTPYAITIDHQSLADGSVTLRDRDSRLQKRFAPNDLLTHLKEKTHLNTLKKDKKR